MNGKLCDFLHRRFKLRNNRHVKLTCILIVLSRNDDHLHCSYEILDKRCLSSENRIRQYSMWQVLPNISLYCYLTLLVKLAQQCKIHSKISFLSEHTHTHTATHTPTHPNPSPHTHTVCLYSHDATMLSMWPASSRRLCELDGVCSGSEPVLVVVHEGGDEHRTLEDVPVGPVLLTPQHVHLQRETTVKKSLCCSRREKNKLEL